MSTAYKYSPNLAKLAITSVKPAQYTKIYLLALNSLMELLQARRHRLCNKMDNEQPITGKTYSSKMGLSLYTFQKLIAIKKYGSRFR